MGLLEKITVGVADLFYTPPGGTSEVYLGLTKGGGEFEYETEWHDVTDIDQFGKTAVDSILIGEKVTYKTNVVDTSLEAIKRVAPTATEIKSGETLKALGFGQRPGLRLQSVAGKLRIHPVSAGIGDKSRDIIMYRAGSKAKMNLNFKLEEEWVVPLELTAYPDEVRPLGDQLFRIGLEGFDVAGPTQQLVNFVVAPSNPSVTKSTTQQFTATAYYEDGTNEDVSDSVTWSISNATIGAFDATGLFTATATTGTGIATAKWGNYSTSTNVTVA